MFRCHNNSNNTLYITNGVLLNHVLEISLEKRRRRGISSSSSMMFIDLIESRKVYRSGTTTFTMRYECYESTDILWKKGLGMLET